MSSLYRTNYNSEEKIWSGQDGQLNSYIHPNSTVGKHIFSSMKENANRICQISDSDGLSFTMGEALTMGIRMAQHFRKMNLISGKDIVGIMATNTSHLLPVLIGCWLNFTPFHVISPISKKDEITHLFGITRPKVIFCDGQNYKAVFESCTILKLNSQIITMKDHEEGENVTKVQDLLLTSTNTEDIFVPMEINEGAVQTAAILCSSGTTGLPKAVCFSTKKLLTKGMTNCEDVVFSFSSMDWYTGLYLLLNGLLIGYTRIITDKAFTPELMLEIIEKYKITFSIISTNQLAQVVKCSDVKRRNKSSLNTLIYCGCPISTSIIMQAQDYFERTLLVNLYGTTESNTIALGAKVYRPHLVGQLYPRIKVKIVDHEGNKLGIDETGEILVYHGEVWNGYYNNPEETRLMQDSDGWFHTGDLGYFDNDGFLYLVDRKKDILKFQGKQYWPNQIEQVIAEISDVVEVCVFGIFHIEDMDRAAAAVIRKAGSPLEESDIVKYVAINLPHHMHLHGGVFFVETLPKTSSGKIKRNVTKQLILKQYKNVGY